VSAERADLSAGGGAIACPPASFLEAPVLDLFARVLLAVVFLAAVVGKSRSRQGFAEFRDSVAEIAPRWLPGPARPVAVAVVAGEAATVVLLTSGAASTGRAVFLAIASAAVGGLAVALLYLSGHLTEVVQYRVTLTVESRLFRRIATLPGLRHLEDPAFHDRLRLAEQAAQEAPGTISGFTQELIRSVVLLASFAGASLVVWPPMTLLLLASVVTAVLAMLATARGGDHAGACHGGGADW
jgi:ABC-type multidrug transport system fused ATPase/permease subunit